MQGPILRGLAARAPYFHNGAAADLSQVVNFYDKRFRMHLTPDGGDAATEVPLRRAQDCYEVMVWIIEPSPE